MESCSSRSAALIVGCLVAWTLSGCEARIGGEGGAASSASCAPGACSGHGACSSPLGVPTCACDPGYEEQGLSCVARDPCAGVECSGHGTCESPLGAARCSCVEDYRPVGVSCVPVTTPTCTPPSWVGEVRHRWQPRLGGVAWVPSQGFWQEAAPHLAEYPRPVLIDMKQNKSGFGYRFDLDTWSPDEQHMQENWFSWDGLDRPASPEDIMRISLDEAPGHVEFVLHLPMPRYPVEHIVYQNAEDGTGYTWQTPEFYGALVQYLFGAAGPASQWGSLDRAYEFSSMPADFNWANLRARRGRVEPYPVVAVILGQEPYYIEGWGEDGAAYAERAEAYRRQIRARGVDVELGFHVRDSGPGSDPERTWFSRMDLSYDDYSFIDLHHYYTDSTKPLAYRRFFPVSLCPGDAALGIPAGCQNWWMDRGDWNTDYTRFLWIVPDTRFAITEFGYGDPDRFELGFGEHGIAITSSFAWNDMGAGMHWATWLAEGMRTNTTWDSSWVLAEKGWSHAQFHIIDGYVTRTPGYYVYQMAQAFHGYDYLDNTLETTLADVGDGVKYPLFVVRVFQDPETGKLHLFALNLGETPAAAVQLDVGGCTVSEWKQLRAASFDDQNPLYDWEHPGAWHPETIVTRDVATLPAPGEPVAVPPVSINHIVLE